MSDTYAFNGKILKAGEPKQGHDLSNMGEGDLLFLRAQIDALLPVKRLSDMNLEMELTLQLRSAQALQQIVLDDALTPANQKAQVMNSVSSTLQQLVKMQIDYYTPERLKKIEAALIKALNKFETEQTKEFFRRYEEILAA